MTYTSKGTIGAEFRFGGQGTVVSSALLSFVPDHDCSIRDGAKTLAVFAAQDSQGLPDAPDDARAGLLMEYGEDKEIKIKASSELVRSCGCTNTKVEIEVAADATATNDGASGLKLVRLKIPA